MDQLGDGKHRASRAQAAAHSVAIVVRPHHFPMTSMTSQFQHEMRPVSLINDAQIIECILRHVGSKGA